MLNVDGSDFPKKGTDSVGVARQHCGLLGKTENCQAGVFVGYSSTKGYGLVDRRLYIPQKWFGKEYAGLREKCAVPEDLTFRTKNQLAADMLPEDTEMETLNRVATMRWPIEQCFEECKSHLGMGHYETRSYRAWYRHMLFVMMAHLFTMMLRIRFKKNGSLDHADG